MFIIITIIFIFIVLECVGVGCTFLHKMRLLAICVENSNGQFVNY